MSDWWEDAPEVSATPHDVEPESPARKMFREAGFGKGASTTPPPAATPRMDTDTPARRMFEDAGFHRGKAAPAPADQFGPPIPERYNFGIGTMSRIPGGNWNIQLGGWGRNASDAYVPPEHHLPGDAGSLVTFGQGVRDAPGVTLGAAAAPVLSGAVLPAYADFYGPAVLGTGRAALTLGRWAFRHPVLSTLGARELTDDLGLTDFRGAALDALREAGRAWNEGSRGP